MMHGYGLGAHMFIFWILIIVIIISIFRDSSSGKNRPSEQGETPMGILKTRYAKGEITKEQYQEMKDKIKD